jgi:potassium-dependent mechanosensitive channel
MFMQKQLSWIAVLLLLIVPIRADGQPSATTSAPITGANSTTNSPTASAPAAIALPDVVSEADSTTAKLREIDASLSSDRTLATVDGSLPEITREIDEEQAASAKLLNSSSLLAALRTAESAWHTLDGNIKVPQQALVHRVATLDGQLKQLDQWAQTWQATLAFAKSSGVPPEILQKINDVLAAIGQTTTATQALRTQTLSAQDRVAEQSSRIQEELTAIQTAQENAVSLLLTRDSAPLWSRDAYLPQANGMAGQETGVAQVQTVRAYVLDKMSTIILHLLGFILLATTLFWLRREVNARVKDDPGLQYAKDVFNAPMATAALLALLTSNWLYPLAPPLFLAGIEAAALIPAIIILRRLINPSLFVVLYAMGITYIFDQVRRVASSSEMMSRSLFIFELLGLTLFLALLIRSRRAIPAEIRRNPVDRVIQAYAHVALFVFVISGLANVLGYVHLSLLLGNGTLTSSYLAVILYAAVRIADALTLSAIEVPPLSRIGMIQRHRPLLMQSMFRIFRWAASLLWLWETLGLFSMQTDLSAKGSALLMAKVGVGTHVLTLGEIIAFGITVWASFFISKMIRYALEEEVFPNLQLPPGIPYTASTLVHYLILILGFFAALEFLGFRLSDFALLAGALGVGLGFGLQNILNNFVSGIILLFERPIKVGDMIQVDTAVGTVERIGIRASIIRLGDGSEVIVPNGNLISNPVTNWTLSNRRRMVVIPATVASGADPQRVMALLVKTARDHSLVLNDPPPQALVTSFTTTALTLELRVWTNDPAKWNQIRSDLSVAVNAALIQANIAIG